MTGEEAERAAFSGDGVLYEFGKARSLPASHFILFSCPLRCE